MRKGSGPIEVGFWVVAILEVLREWQIEVRWAYIPTKLNVLADILSRGGALCSPPPVVLDAGFLRRVVGNIDVVVCSDM